MRQATDQKIADKKKVDYQEGLEKSCADSQYGAMTAT